MTQTTDETPIPTDLGDEGVIEHLKACRRNQAETIMGLLQALEVIRDMPLPEQDNMISANMREVARQAIGTSDEAEEVS